MKAMILKSGCKKSQFKQIVLFLSKSYIEVI